MTVTAIGAFLVPLAVICTLFRPSYLLALLAVSSVFQAGSVANGKIGGFEFGVPPFYFVATCIALRFLLLVFGGAKLLPEGDCAARKIALYLVGFWAWSVASAFINPFLFSGVGVYSPREGIDEQYLYPTPLRWSMSNAAQAVFLSLAVIVVLYALQVLRSGRETERTTKAFYLASLFAASVGAFQWIAVVKGWSFPYQLLNSNPVYSQGFDQMLGEWGRVSSTFTEPSFAGAFLAAVASGLLGSFLSGKRTALQLSAIAAVLVMLVGTTATTGYVGFVLACVVLFVYFSPLSRQKEHRRFYRRGWLAVSLSATAGMVALFINPALLEATASALSDKAETLSFVHRVAADANAMSLVGGTYGLGVGLGSSRPSSLVLALLSTVGIPGAFLFAGLLFCIFRNFRGRSKPPAVHMTFWALVGLLICQSVSVPDLSFPVLWTLLAVVASQVSSSQASAKEVRPILVVPSGGRRVAASQ